MDWQPKKLGGRGKWLNAGKVYGSFEKKKMLNGVAQKSRNKSGMKWRKTHKLVLIGLLSKALKERLGEMAQRS